MNVADGGRPRREVRPGVRVRVVGPRVRRGGEVMGGDVVGGGGVLEFAVGGDEDGFGSGLGALDGSGGWTPNLEMISWRIGFCAGVSWGNAGAGLSFANVDEVSGVSSGPATLC